MIFKIFASGKYVAFPTTFCMGDSTSSLRLAKAIAYQHKGAVHAFIEGAFGYAV